MIQTSKLKLRRVPRWVQNQIAHCENLRLFFKTVSASDGKHFCTLLSAPNLSPQILTKTMKSRLLLLASLCLALTSQAQTVVYENIGTNGPLGGYSEPNANHPIFGDALNLAQGGTLSHVGLTLFNSTSGGNTGAILTGTTTLNIYNNTVPYAGGSLSASDPLVASVLLTWTFSGSGLQPGFFTVGTFDLTSLNIAVPQNIFMTQQFTLSTGTSINNGVVLFPNPSIGTSPANVYINSSATPEGLYTFSGGNPNQFGYHIDIQVVPEPTTFALAGLGAAALVVFRRRK